MKCEMCGIHEATVHVRQIMGNRAVDVHLCSDCAEKSGISEHEQVADLSVSQLLTGLIEKQTEESTGDTEIVCPACGTSAGEFRKTGKVGCPDCYERFKPEIFGVFENMCGVARHRGKLPKKLMTYKTIMVDKQNLKQKLKEAVDNEDYESAAALRDRIRSFESLEGENG